MQDQRVDMEGARTNRFKIATALVGGMRIGYTYTSFFKPKSFNNSCAFFAEHVLIAFSLRGLMNNQRDQLSIAAATLLGAVAGAITSAMTSSPSP